MNRETELQPSHADEARLTAYALGELDDAEREAVDQELAASEVARSAVAEIRRSIELMTAALASEPPGQLSATERERIDQRIEACERPVVSLQMARLIRLRRRLAVAAAACLALGFSGWLFWPSMQAAREAGRSGSVAFRSDGLEGEVMNQALRGSNDPAAAGQGLAEEIMAEVKPSYAIRDGRESKSQSRNHLTSLAPKTAKELTRHHYYSEQIQESAPSGGAGGQVTDRITPRYTTVKPTGTPKSKKSPSTVNKPVYETKTRRAPDGPQVLDPLPKPDLGAEGLATGRGDKNVMIGGLVQDSQVESMPAAFDGEGFNTEAYARIAENPFLEVRQNPLSTFSIDVDTASYANVRRFLNQGSLPPKDAVRIEELVNYFKYHYAPPAGDAPFAVHAEVAGCPWAPKHRLLRVALKGREIDFNNRPASNLVFLVDVSGSMDEPNKLPLLKAALRLLIDRLSENDRIAMVVYAGSSGLVLPSTTGDHQAVIAGALEQLQAGGSTNGASGIQLAYEVARQGFIRGGTNRVMLCTDGDFNVGVTDEGALTRLIESEAKSGVFLSVLGFGAGNYKDATMEKLADRGNGNYAYIDGLDEARKVLVEQAGGTLLTIAKDVKLQLEFNPSKVAAYRLVGYENRLLRDEDFNDDAKDAGEIGAGHTVTAFYELVPAGGESPAAPVDPLKYQKTVEPAEAAASDEILTLKLRYKEPEGAKSKLLSSVVKDSGGSYAQAGEDFQFAAAVAAFGLVLRDSQFKGDMNLAAVLELAAASRGADEGGYRAEFIELVKKAQAIAGER
ncbi:MAG TPA: von Willebrand factor type A domain-containing protein [Pirellulales bacterium]|nr:von Willebrand factor type A domain-containing protein [Pirellulales bacterium]